MLVFTLHYTLLGSTLHLFLIKCCIWTAN